MPARKKYFRYDPTQDAVVEVERKTVVHRPRWPLPVEALAVNPSQIGEARAFDRANGVATDYRRDGTPIMTDASHYKQYRRLHGFYDRSGYES